MGFLRTLVSRLFSTQEARQMLPIGSPAPDFEVPDHLGRMVRLADLRGRRAVLWFYPKASTPG